VNGVIKTFCVPSRRRIPRSQRPRWQSSRSRAEPPSRGAAPKAGRARAVFGWLAKQTTQAIGTAIGKAFVAGIVIIFGLVAAHLTGLWKPIVWVQTMLSSTHSIDAQLDGIRASAEHQDRRVIYQHEITLHGTKSYVIVVGDSRLEPRLSGVDQGLHATGSVSKDANGNVTYRENPIPPHAPEASSDELRVYDVSGNQLVLRLEFEPVLTRLGSTTFEEGSKPYELHRLRFEDVDGDGRLELTGFFSYFLPDVAKPIPFVVNWDDESRKYLLRALLPEPPAQGAAAGDRAHRFDETYRQRAVLKDVRSDLVISGYRMHAFTFFRHDGEIPLLLAAFVNGPTSSRGIPLDLQAWKLNLAARGGQLLLTPCFPNARVQLWEPQTLDSVSKAAETRLGKAWSPYDASAC
jgi:hypothetical protein